MENLIVSARGQLTLPAKLRKRLGIEPGGVVVAEEKDGALVLRPAAVTPVRYYTESEVSAWTVEDVLPEAERDAYLARVGERLKELAKVAGKAGK